MIKTIIMNRKGGYLRKTLLSSLIAVASFQANADNKVLEELVVTAQKKAQSLQDVPVAISVVSGNSISNEAIKDLGDLSAKIPTVKISQTVVGELINIRGFGSGNNIGFEQSVATFVDGSYRGRAVSRRLGFLDVSQIEVLKGPQTIYFGANATAGAFQITTRKANPGNPTEANVTAYYEPKYKNYILEAGASTSLTDMLAGRVAVKLSGGDGYIKNKFWDRDEAETEDYVVRGSIAWQPNNQYRMDLRVDAGEVDSMGGGEGELISCGDFKYGYTPAPTDNTLCNAYLGYAATTNQTVDGEGNWKNDGGGANTHFKAEFTEFALTNRWDLDAGVLTAVTTYYDHESDRLSSPAPYPLPNNLGEFGGFFPARFYEEFNQFTQEIRFETTITDTIDMTVGGYYLDNELTSDQYIALLFIPAGVPPGIGTYFDLGQEEQTYSLFSAFDLRATEQLTFSLGLRYTDVRKEGHGNNSAGIFSTSNISPSVYTALPLAVQQGVSGLLGLNLDDYAKPVYKDSAVQPSVGVSWDASGDTMLYAKYNEGFKAGGFGFTGPLDTFVEEDVKAYEIGMKSTLLEGSMFLSVAAFLNQYDNLQESGNRTTPSGGVVTYVANVGSVEAKGLELGVKWLATKDLTIAFDVAYLDSVYDIFKNATCDEITAATSPVGTSCDLSGETRPFAPKYSGTLKLTYVKPLGSNEITIEPSVDFSSSFDTLATLDPVGYQESYEKLNLRLAYGPSDDSWKIALIGKNLTDEYTADFRNISPSSPGTAVVFPNPPRTIGFQFNWNY